jgi:hypothetical protein
MWIGWLHMTYVHILFRGRGLTRPFMYIEANHSVGPALVLVSLLVDS